MGLHYLHPLFEPAAIAVFGADERTGSTGTLVCRNLLAGGFSGPIHLINPGLQQIGGRPCHPSLAALSGAVDLALIAVPEAAMEAALEDCRAHGVRAAILLSSQEDVDPTLTLATVDGLRKFGTHGPRILGPDSLGLMRPGRRLNASLVENLAPPGSLALLSQSGALGAAVLDWAEARGIGFSAVAVPGVGADIRFGDLLDYLALDPATRAILVYLEAIHDARRFLSGLRAAARLKPVVVIRAGQRAEAATAAAFHTGALIGADDVFHAALRRAGVIRVDSIGQLFAAAELLAASHRLHGERLAIVSNAGAPAIMAADHAVNRNLNLATLGSAVVRALPPATHCRNPLDLGSRVTPEQYAAVLRACLDDPGTDGVLALYAPKPFTAPTETAAAILTVADSPKPLLTCWLGEGRVAQARNLFEKRGISSFRNPESAIDAFAVLAEFRRNQTLLLQVPGPVTRTVPVDFAAARGLLRSALAENRTRLSNPAARELLRLCGIPAAPALAAATADEAVAAAEHLGFPVALKILSLDIPHKSDVGGVRLNLIDAASLRQAFGDLLAAVRKNRPEAQIEGVTVEPMYLGKHGRELLIAIVPDPVFGPAITFAAGGTTVEILRDRSVALPPLNALLADQMIDQTRIAALLGPFRNLPAANRGAIVQALLKLAAIACELPEIAALEINPLVVDETGVEALDVRIDLTVPPPNQERYGHMAIHPYPADLETRLVLKSGADVVIRPIRPEDAAIEMDFVHKLSPEAKFFRFMSALQNLTPELLVRLTQLDYARELALIAITGQAGQEIQIGVARYSGNPDGETAEFALAVADQWQHQGLGRQLMTRLIEAARARQIRAIEGQVLANNRKMLALMTALGFRRRCDPGDSDIMIVTKDL